MLNKIKGKLPRVTSIISLLGSPKTVAVVKIAVAVITLAQSIDLYRDSNRKIGFKK